MVTAAGVPRDLNESSCRSSPPDELDILINDPKTAFTRREQFYRTAGAFAIRDLPAGAFVLTAIAAGARKQIGVPLAEGEHKTGVTLTLDATVTLTGRVVEMISHQPVAGLRMSARAATLGSIDSSASGDSITDDAGRFSLSDVPTGRVWIFGVPKEPNGWTTLQAVRTVTGSGTVDIGDLPIRHSRLEHPGDQHGYLGLHFEPLPPGITPDQRQGQGQLDRSRRSRRACRHPRGRRPRVGRWRQHPG